MSDSKNKNLIVTGSGGGGGGGKSGGGGGGSGGGPNFSESPNTLQGNVRGSFIDLLSEGEIEGLVDDEKSIFLAETAYQNNDDSYNYSGVTYAIRNGLPNQTYLPGFTNSANEVDVSTEVTFSTPITRSITNNEIDQVSIKIRIPQLTNHNTSSNSITGTSVQIRISLNDVSAGTFTISGKTTTPYEQAFKISLVDETFPVAVKVERLTADSTSASLVNKTFWSSFSEIIDSKFSYPDTAIIGLQLDAKNFGNNLPTRAYLIKGIKVKIPSNYTPATRTYSGVWDGTFIVAWTNNPAWIFYDLLINDRYGLGDYLTEADIDKYSLYSIAQYCDELVDNGMGGTEPRYTFNGAVEGRQDAYSLLQQIVSVFRGITYYKSGLITAVSDKPEDPVKLFNRSNVVNGKFVYQSTPYSQKYSVAIVTFNDPNNNYRQSIEVVEDHDLLLEIGERKLEITATFCTSRGQAHRTGKWALDTAKNSTQSVNFKVGLDGADVYPGNIVEINDPELAGERMGGRIVSVSGTTVVIDNDFTIASDRAYNLLVIAEDGTRELRLVTNSAATTNTLTIASEFTNTISTNSVYIISADNLIPKKWRIISITEAEKALYDILATEYDSTKFDRVESNLNLEPDQTSLITDFSSAVPDNLTLSNNVVINENTAFNEITASWDPVTLAVSYEYQYRIDDGNFTDLVKTSVSSLSFEGNDGEYVFRVRSKDILGRVSDFASVTFVINKNDLPIDDVTNFTSVRQGSDVLLAWNPIQSEVLRHYEIRKGNSWNAAYVVGTTTNNLITISDPQASRYLIKALSFYERYSDNATFTDTITSTTQNILQTRDEKALGWTGTKTNFSVNGAGNLEYATSPSAPINQGTYETPVIDLGVILFSRFVFDASFSVSSSVSLLELSTSFSTLGDIPATHILGGNQDAITVRFLISSSNDNVTYSTFTEYLPGFIKGRYFKIKMQVDRDTDEDLPIIDALTITMDAPGVSESHNDVSVDSGGLTFNHTKTYNNIPIVVAAIQNGSAGDTVRKNTTLTTTTFNLYDSAGSAKSGAIDIFISGF